jgi:ribosomal protein S18 acetylase RimI-like enzyme
MNISDITINRAKPNNVADILEVQKITWLATYVNKEFGITIDDILSKDFTRKDRVERLLKIILNEQSTNRVLVACDNDLVVAFCRLQKGEQNNKLIALYVLPDYQNHGIGKKLITSALEWFGSDKNIVLDVVSYNARAREFYKHFNFKSRQNPRRRFVYISIRKDYARNKNDLIL